MSCGDRLIMLVVIATCGCSVGNRIDTCDAPATAEKQVNSVTGGDQFTTYGRALTRLPSGKFIATWVSEDQPGDGAPTQVRAAILDAEGRVVPPCGSVAGDVAISTAIDQVAVRPAVAVGPTAQSPVYFVWRSAPSGGVAGPGKALVRLMTQELCPYNQPPNDKVIFTASDATDDASAPVVAVRDDGKEALVAWISTPAFAGGPFRIRSRPVGTSRLLIGALEPNGCDGLEAPCTHATLPLAGAPAIAAYQGGYGLAWGAPRADSKPGYETRLQVLNRLGAIVSDTRGPRSSGDVLFLELWLAQSGDDLALVSAGQPRVDFAVPDDDVFLERFGAGGQSLGAPIRVNDQTTGVQTQPTVLPLSGGALFIAWTSKVGEDPPEVFGRVLDSAGAPMFVGLACDTTDFKLASGGTSRRFGAALAGDASGVLGVFTDATPVTGGTDTLGLSVHARPYDLEHLIPALK